MMTMDIIKKSTDYNDDRYNYDNRPIKGSGGAYGNSNKYKDNYEEDNYKAKKKEIVMY